MGMRIGMRRPDDDRPRQADMFRRIDDHQQPLGAGQRRKQKTRRKQPTGSIGQTWHILLIFSFPTPPRGNELGGRSCGHGKVARVSARYDAERRNEAFLWILHPFDALALPQSSRSGRSISPI